MERSIVYRCVWVPSAIALVVMTVAFARGPVADATPGKLVPFSTDDKAISLQHPENWKPQAESMNAVVTMVHFDPAPHIHFGVKADLAGSLLADASRPPGGMPPSGDSSGQSDASGGAGAAGRGAADSAGSGGGGSNITSQLQSLTAQNPQLAAQLGTVSKDPLTAAHQRQGASLSTGGEYPGMKDGDTQKVQVAGFEALSTGFTFHSSDLLSPVSCTGTRITILSGERQISIVGYCPTKDKDIYNPVFQKMLASLALGQGGSQ